MAFTLGYHGVHKTSVHASEATADRVAALLTDPRWPWQPSIVRPLHFPGRPVYPWPAGRVSAAKIQETVRDILVSESTTGITLVASRQDAGNHAWLDVRSGQAEYTGYATNTAYAFDIRAMCRAHGLPRAKSIDAWIEVMHELTLALDVPNAVIWAGPDERPIIALLYGTGSERPDMVVDSPRYEVLRVSRSRAELGSKWIRPPAWGTYLRPEHVTAVGGRERIVEVVAPPVVRNVGELLYVQMSEHVADALSPEVEARRRAFADLLEPITVPRLS